MYPWLKKIPFSVLAPRLALLVPALVRICEWTFSSVAIARAALSNYVVPLLHKETAENQTPHARLAVGIKISCSDARNWYWMELRKVWWLVVMHLAPMSFPSRYCTPVLNQRNISIGGTYLKLLAVVICSFPWTTTGNSIHYFWCVFQNVWLAQACRGTRCRIYQIGKEVKPIPQ